ncbi:MAG: SMEK domain-containing protein [Terriglobales bacterium]
MLERQKLIEDIRKGVAALQSYIQPGGALNLTDTNVHAETFTAGLLNTLFGWGLVNVNRDTANSPCIDLIDNAQGLAIQVTSEKGSVKLKKTIECLKRHKRGSHIRSLKVFSLTPRQKRYTVNTKCPGIKFDWRNDVLDFNDVAKAVNQIADLHQLRKVHEYIVSAIPSVFPEYQRQPPPLTTPATDPAIAWLAFSSRATRLVGRDAELNRLSAFLDANQNFCWWLVSGVGGSGKSRLALELCRSAAEWHAGFLSRTATNFNWSRFRPSRKTLIVIDYVASRAKEVSDLVLTLSRDASSFENPVRVLLLERNKETWWPVFSRDDSQSEAAEIGRCQYNEPLALLELPVDAVLRLAEEVVSARNGKWDGATAIRYLFLLARFDPDCRPLFAMILAQELDNAEVGENISNLLRRVLTKESGRRRQLIHSEDLQRMENLLLLATLVGAILPRSDGFNFVITSDVANLLPNMNLLSEDLYNDIAWSTRGGSFIPGLQPDILGERFVLDRLSAGGVSATQAQRLLRAAWTFQPQDVRIVAIRSASDFPGDNGLSYLYDLPLDTSEARAEWVTMVAQMIGVTRGEDQFTQRQLEKTSSLADRFPQEPRLQEAAAMADYNMGCNMQFRPYKKEEAKRESAAKRFDAVVARVGNDSVIGLSAVLNRGCLYESDGEKDKAIHAFTVVIESRKAPDEARACAFNNRANIYADRGDYENAIRDRTEVLALKATSADRRFVALFRRSESHCAIEHYAAAVDDLSKILETDDIASDDKLRATLERAVVLAQHLDRQDEARANLRSVLSQAKRLPKELRDHLRLILGNKENNIEETRKMWKELSNMARRSANRVRIAPLRIDEGAL